MPNSATVLEESIEEFHRAVAMGVLTSEVVDERVEDNSIKGFNDLGQEIVIWETEAGRPQQRSE